MNIKTFTTALLLCALLSACSTAPLCIKEAEINEPNGSQTSSEVYNECTSAQLKKNAKEDTFFDEVGVFFIDLFVLIAD
jgi:starvation-inducible outer membrane lipoprotein